MKRIVLGAILCLSCQAFVWAQDTGNASSIGVKLLFIDYGLVNDIDSLELTNGIEVEFLRDLSKKLRFGIPLRTGVINVTGDKDNKTFFGLDGLLQYKLNDDKENVLPYLLGGVGMAFEEGGQSDLQIPLGLGVNFRVGSQSFVNFQGAFRVSTEEDRSNLQAGLGYIYRFVKMDADGDGVSDHMDDCPDIAGVASLSGCPDRDGDQITDAEDLCPDRAGPIATNGCPDTDGDGITDGDDECPETVGTLNGCPDTDDDGLPDKDDKCPNTKGTTAMMGCPDSDGDGVADPEDECPRQPGLPINNGCPAVDSDKDGIGDVVDLCPELPGPTTTQGCPDGDGDGVADKDDRCPDKAGRFTGCPDTDNDGVIDPDDKCPEQMGSLANEGCPELKAEEKEVLEFAMRAVQFETGRAALLPESYPVLDQIIQIMQRYPGYKLAISGHTDNTGDPGFNQRLSEQRAFACYSHIVSTGVVNAKRVSYKGFGQSSPIADNDTPEGRRLNRRVEFELYIE